MLYHRGNITSEVADFKGTLSDSDGDIIALKWTKDLDQICLGYWWEHLLYMWSQGPEPRCRGGCRQGDC